MPSAQSTMSLTPSRASIVSLPRSPCSTSSPHDELDGAVDGPVDDRRQKRGTGQIDRARHLDDPAGAAIMDLDADVAGPRPHEGQAFARPWNGSADVGGHRAVTRRA
jgi:hypothetical protein